MNATSEQKPQNKLPKENRGVFNGEICPRCLKEAHGYSFKGWNKEGEEIDMCFDCDRSVYGPMD